MTTQQQIDELLDELAADLGASGAKSDADRPDPDRPDPDRLAELGDRADAIVSATKLSELLAATGLEDGCEEPASLPAAIASGDPHDVATLRTLLSLSKLPDADDETAAEVASELNALVEAARSEPKAGDAVSADDEVESVESDAESAANGAKSRADGAESAADTESTEGDTASPLREAVASQLGEVQSMFEEGPLIDGLVGRINEGEVDDEQTEDDREATDEVDETGKVEEADRADTEESEAGTMPGGDQSRGRSGDGTRWRPGGGRSTTHSTVPRSTRRDIGHSTRFSTVRGSTVSKR